MKMEISGAEQPVLAPRFRPVLMGLFVLCLLLFGFRLGSVPLFDLDEALYVTCARNMVQGGDWVTPLLNSRPPYDPNLLTVPFFEKPIFVYWAAAGSMRLFGISEWAARLPTLLAALAMTGAIVWAGAKLFRSPRAGLLAGLVYATVPMTLLDARQMTTDGLLVLWFALALGAFWWRKGWLFWSMCALCILTKGIVGLLLPLFIIGIHTLLEKRRTRRNLLPSNSPRWKSLLSLSGLLLFLAIALPWHLAIAQTTRRDAQGRTWTQEYVIRQHVGRFKGMDQVHNLSGIYSPAYIPFFLIGFFPWSCFALAAFRMPKPAAEMEAESSPETEETANEAHRFLLVWFWTIFLFFSASAAKLPTYIVPAYPAAALLLGRWLDRVELPHNRSLIRGAIGCIVTSAVLLGAVSIANRFIPKASPLPEGVQSLVAILMAILLAGSMVACGLFLGKRKTAGIGALAAMMTVMLGVGVTHGYNVAAQNVMRPFQQPAEDANAAAQQGIPTLFYNIIPRRPSMLYYSAYSPTETRETPLVPYLRSCLSADTPEIQIITSSDTLNASLRAEFTNAPDLSVETKPSGGWVRLIVTRKPAVPAFP